MPFTRATLSQLRAQAASDLAAALPGTDPLLPVSNLGILADILAEGFNAEYAYLDYIARQALPFTAEDEAFEGWAGLKGVTRKSPTAATGTGTWTGVVGAILPAGTPVNRGDGSAYVTTADASVGVGGSVTANLVAVTAGSAGTLSAGSALVLAQSIAGISATGVSAPLTPGTDLELFEDFRTRVLEIYAAPPQGGSAADYKKWALEVPGVTRAWPLPNGRGPGTVVVYFMMDDAEAAFDGFPQGVDGVAAGEPRDTPATLDKLTVADWILPLQPVTALVYVQAPQANTVAFTISLPSASLVLKAAIAEAIRGVFLAYGEPGGVVTLSRIDSAIASISGTDGFVITAESCTHGSVSPSNGNITSNSGYLPVLGAVTWI